MSVDVPTSQVAVASRGVRADRAASTPSLLPREHGAYGQLALPLLSAFAVSAPTWSSLALAVGFAAAFLAHEPLLVALGQRGGRARRDHGARAVRRGIALSVVAALGLVTGAALGGPAVCAGLVLPGGFALALAPFVRARRERSLAGEVLAAAALSATAVPVVRAGGGAWATALVLFAVWAVAFAEATLVIRGVIAASRGEARARLGLRAVIPAATLVAGIALWPLGATARAFALGVAPTCGLALLLALAPPPARRIRAVGWSNVAASVVTLLALAASLG